MKKSFFSLFAVFFLLFAACNSKSEKDSVASENNYFQSKVGENENGVFKVTNAVAIKKDWEARLSKNYKGITLNDLKIIKGATPDEKPVEYYLLIGSSTDGKLRMASLLNLKNNSFYLDTRQDQDGSVFYSKLVCKGICSEGCLPVVNIYNNTKYLNCSPCIDCVKEETEIR